MRTVFCKNSDALVEIGKVYLFFKYIKTCIVMEDKTPLLQHMGDAPELRILDFFLDNSKSGYSKKEIMEYTGISKTAFYEVWDEILKFDFIKTTRKYGKAQQLCAINKDNVLGQKLKDIDEELCKQVMQRAMEEPIPAN